MRVLSAAVQAKIATNLGIEPVNILEVQWSGLSGNWSKYSDKDIVGYEFDVAGKILDISNLESIIKLDSQGQSQGLSVMLSDSDGALKNIFNTIDLHGKRCKLYQWFEGLPLSERFELYEGEITSPIVWSEGERTLSFEVITQLSDKEIGFSPEEGYFEFLPESAYGKPWPLAFGTVQNVPATRLSEVPNSTTAEPLGVVDPSLSSRGADLGEQLESAKYTFLFYMYANLTAMLTCSSGDTPEIRSSACSLADQLQSTMNAALVQIASIEADIASILNTAYAQGLEQNNQLTIVGGSIFPQGEVVTLLSGDIRLQGTFSGDVFSIIDMDLTSYTGYDNKNPFGFTWQKEGTTITIQSDSPIVYIVNLLPSTILYVSAYKQVDNGRVLTSIPQSWYTVKTLDLESYTITYLTFSKPISSFDSTYEDDIYVSMTSPTGPNTVDILEWLIATYTDMSTDSTSFAAVKVQLENYPSHFALLTRRNILTVLEEIAFQSRCSIWISDRVFYLRYLPEEQTEVDTLTEAEVDAGSLTIKSSTTEEIVTKLVSKWRIDYAAEEANEIILRHNVNRYGIREREIDFYIYNIFELVMKSTTFWIIRMSNVWKNLDFSVFLDRLKLETFDIIKFNFAEDFVASSAIKGTITATSYDSAAKIINMTAWLPIKCGSMTRYDFAEPHDISVDLLFPTNDEIADGSAGGDGPGAEVEGGISLAQSFIGGSYGGGYRSRSSREEDGERIQGRDYGELRPTDIDDEFVYPSITSQPSVYSEEPTYDYEYSDHDLEVADEDAAKEWSHSYPGQITGGSGDTYTVDVYKFGLSSTASTITVRQLQIADGTDLPIGTWVLVTYNRWPEGSGDTQEIREEYTMQAPVWL